MYKLVEEVDVKELKGMVAECNSYDDSLDWLDYRDNDEEFFDTFFTKPMDAVRAAYFGKYKYSDEYVRFDGYGNLKSASEWEYEEELEEYKDEIIKKYIELLEDNEVSNYDYLFEEVDDE